MITKIDLFMPPTSQYGVLHHFTKKMYEALVRSGVICRLLQAERHNPKPFLQQIFQDPPDCTLSFNGLLPDDEGRFFCDMIQIPHVACLVDSPNLFFSLVKSPNTIITCVDRFSCDFFHGMNFNHVLFMPHAVEKNLTAGDEERIYDVTFLGSCMDYEENRKGWSKKYPIALCKAMDEAAEITLSDHETSYVQALVQAIDKRTGVLDPQKIGFVEVLDDLESYIRGVDRVEMIKGIKDAEVDIFGAGEGLWKKYLGKGVDNVTVHEPVPFEQALEVMKRSKIVMNSCPWIKNGAHERIFSGLACGALVITSENIYMREHFKDGVNIGFYRHQKWAEINETVNSYLNDEDKRLKVAAAGRHEVMHHHTWDHRAAGLLRELVPILKRIADRA